MSSQSKQQLRKSLRLARRQHVSTQPSSIRGLLFHRPPATVLPSIAAGAVIGLYHATPAEAPARSYSQFFIEAGRTIALPAFTNEGAPMEFRAHTDPLGESDLEGGPYGIMQPSPDATLVTPNVLFVPLIGFTDELDRLGQGGGHYDRWLAQHPDTVAIGLAWDAQLVEPANALPTEHHDVKLAAVITPTRIYGLN